MNIKIVVFLFSILFYCVFHSLSAQDCVLKIKIHTVEKYGYCIENDRVTGTIEIENKSDSVLEISAVATGGLVFFSALPTSKDNPNAFLLISPHNNILYQYNASFDKVFRWNKMTLEEAMQKNDDFKNGMLEFAISFYFNYLSNNKRITKGCFKSIPVEIIFTKDDLR
jgi:hypothetical protein